MRKIIKKKEIDVPIYKTEVRKIQVGTKKEKQKVYVAEDGTEFDSFKNCKKYEIDSFKKFIDSLPHVESFISPYDYSYSLCLTGGWHWYYFKTYEEFENFALHKIYKESQVDAILEEAKTFNFPD